MYILTRVENCCKEDTLVFQRHSAFSNWVGSMEGWKIVDTAKTPPIFLYFHPFFIRSLLQERKWLWDRVGVFSLLWTYRFQRFSSTPHRPDPGLRLLRMVAESCTGSWRKPQRHSHLDRRSRSPERYRGSPHSESGHLLP